MRRIKFRAWDIENQRFGYLSHPFDNNWYVESSEYGTVEVAFPNNWKDKDGYREGSFEITQYTGLPDKNGKEIYEGDIIRAWFANAPKSEHVGVVVFHNGKFMIRTKICETGTAWAPLADGVQHVSYDKSVYITECEILGNIYENPDLLGGETHE